MLPDSKKVFSKILPMATINDFQCELCIVALYGEYI